MGQEINHQYSKTFEFENLFKDYSKKYLSKEAKKHTFKVINTEVNFEKKLEETQKFLFK